MVSQANILDGMYHEEKIEQLKEVGLISQNGIWTQPFFILEVLQERINHRCQLAPQTVQQFKKIIP
jgi:hypothetical protein